MIFLELHSIGIPDMKIANLFEDIHILKVVQKLSAEIIKNDVNLEKKENVKLKKLVKSKFTGKINI